MTGIVAVLDACVLYPAALRDLFVRLGKSGLFQAKWTDEIHEEWIRNLLANRSDLKRERLERTRDLMNYHVPASLIPNYQHHIPLLSFPDIDDRHILAAAIECGASVIVTFNLKDFPESTLLEYGITPQHPDQFLIQLLANDQSIFCSTLRTQRLDLEFPSVSAESMLTVLEAQGLPGTVQKLKSLSELL